jgi:hypothetical protein
MDYCTIHIPLTSSVGPETPCLPIQVEDYGELGLHAQRGLDHWVLQDGAQGLWFDYRCSSEDFAGQWCIGEGVHWSKCMYAL